MRSTNDTSLILLALDKTLIDNERKLNERGRNGLMLAVFKTVMDAPPPAEALAAVKAERIKRENQCRHYSR